MRNCGLFLFFQLVVCIALCQEPSYKLISTEHGLASRTIYDIIQLQNGKIYIGHERGLSSFNGMEIINYNNDKKTTPLSNLTEYKGQIVSRNFVNELFVTKDDNTVQRLDQLSKPEIGICHLLNYNNRLFKKSNNQIIEFGLSSSIEKSKVIYQSDISIGFFQCLNDTMYVLLAGSIVRFPIDNPKIRESVPGDFGKGSSLFLLYNKVAIFCPSTGEIICHPFQKKQSIIQLSNFDLANKSTTIQQLSDGKIYIGTFGGLLIYDSSGRLMQSCYNDVQISVIYQDIESNVWIGTLHDGIRLVSNMKVQTFRMEEPQKISRVAVVNQHTLLLGTYDGKLYRYYDNGQRKLIHDFNCKNEIQSIYNNGENTWVYCSDLFKINSTTGSIVKIPNMGPTKCVIARNDTLFCGTSRGLMIVSPKGNVDILNEALWIKNAIIYEGQLLFETSAGLMVYESNQLKTYSVGYHKRHMNLKDASNLVVIDKVMYFSLNKCVYQLKGNNIIQKYDASNYLNTISKISAINQRLYVTDGAIIIEFHKGRIQKFDQTKGLQMFEIMDIKTWGENLVVAGINYFQLIPSKIVFPEVTHKIRLLTTEGTFDLKGGNYISSYQGNILSMCFEYSPNISALGGTTVYYRMNGVSNDWKKMEYKNGGYRIDERRIPIGETTLEVYAEDSDFNKTKTLTYHLLVIPPFYIRWWFFVLCALVILMLFLFIYKQRLKIVQRKNEQQMEQEILKTKVISSELKALRSQMNPHFIFNSLSSIQSKILNDESKEAYTNLSAFSKLLRQSLKFTSKEFITLEQELDFLNNYIILEQGRMERSFKVDIDVDPSLDCQEAQFPSLSSQPFVENAIRHGLAHSSKEKVLMISIEGTADNFLFIIEDNGIGREASKEINWTKNKNHISFATNAMEERIQMINAHGLAHVELKIEDLSTGTKVILTINRNHEHN